MESNINTKTKYGTFKIKTVTKQTSHLANYRFSLHHMSEQKVDMIHSHNSIFSSQPYK